MVLNVIRVITVPIILVSEFQSFGIVIDDAQEYPNALGRGTANVCMKFKILNLCLDKV